MCKIENLKCAATFLAISLAFALYALTWVGVEPVGKVETFKATYSYGMSIGGATIMFVASVILAITSFIQKK